MDDPDPDAEARLRQKLGLSGATQPSPGADPQRAARQAIRSQAAAREYAERQLARAEKTIQDLGSKLHAVRRERDIAVEAARTALAAEAQAERGLRAAEATLIGAKTAGERAQREIQEGRATIQDLGTRLALANETVEALRTQLEQEREARNAAGRERVAARAPAGAEAIGDASGDPPVKRRRGRPPGKREPAGSRPAAAADDAGSQQPVKWWTDGWKPAG